MPAFLKPLTIRIFSPILGIQALSLFFSLGVSIKTTFFTDIFLTPEESAQTWQRFYLFNELKTLHDEREAFQTPAFLFTNARLTRRRKEEAEEEERREEKEKKTLT